jgi:Flp pilus assembly protein TadD
MEQAKAEGNTAFSNGDAVTAVQKFTEALSHAPENAVLYSNRSAAHATQVQRLLIASSRGHASSRLT